MKVVVQAPARKVGWRITFSRNGRLVLTPRTRNSLKARANLLQASGKVRLQEETVQSANLALQLTLNQYKAGTVAYTSVVTAQTAALAARQSLLTIHQNQLTNAVSLLQALGGGWSGLTTAAAP